MAKRLIVGTKRRDKEFLWLQAIHIIDDMRDSGEKNIHKILRKLNTDFFIKKRKTIKK